jgi:hypothetical protein
VVAAGGADVLVAPLMLVLADESGGLEGGSAPLDFKDREGEDPLAAEGWIAPIAFDCRTVKVVAVVLRVCPDDMLAVSATMVDGVIIQLFLLLPAERSCYLWEGSSTI